MTTKKLVLDVHEDGQIFFEGKPLPLHRSVKRGYASVQLLAHRLVTHAFYGPPPTSKHVCHHKDGNTRNNSADNLCWVTQSENMKLLDYGPRKKLTPKQVREILTKKPDPVVSLNDLAIAYGVSRHAINAVRSGINWQQGWRKTNRGILTAQQIERIRQWHKPEVTAAGIGAAYKVSSATILNIWHGRRPVE